MKLTLNEFPEILIELKNLAQNFEININSKEVEESKFYILMQKCTNLDASSLNVKSEIILLITRIAAISPYLKEINISNNKLGECGPIVIGQLAKSNSIEIIDMAENNLGEFYLNTAYVLLKSRSIKKVNFKNNSDIYSPIYKMMETLIDHNYKTDLHNNSLFVGWHALLEKGILKVLPTEIIDQIFTEHYENHIDFKF